MAWTEIAARIQTAGQSVFGETVTFTPSGGNPEIVTGIFSAEHIYQELVGDTVVETTKPTVIVRSAALSQTPVRRDSISVRAIGFTVIEIMPDGQGDLALVLETAS